MPDGCCSQDCHGYPMRQVQFALGLHYPFRHHFPSSSIVDELLCSLHVDEEEILYLPLAVIIAQVLVGLSKQLKQVIQIEHNIVKNPNWPESNRLAI